MTAYEFLKSKIGWFNGNHPVSIVRDGELPDWRDIIDWLDEYAEIKLKESEEVYEPYFGWCDVDGCKNEGSCGGAGWRETGYWTLCSKHSTLARKGYEQPTMKLEAIAREKTRDKKTGYLPFKEEQP